MNNFKEKLRILLSLRKMTAESLCQQIGMTKQNLHYIYNRGSIETKHLEKISEILQVNPSYFFQENTDQTNQVQENEIKYQKPADDYQNYHELIKKEMECREALFKAQQTIIELQERIIKIQDNKDKKNN